jgi:hypothetical protein
MLSEGRLDLERQHADEFRPRLVSIAFPDICCADVETCPMRLS